MDNTRRRFLALTGGTAAAFLLGARWQDKPKALKPTEDNIEGPYWRREAPFREGKFSEGVEGEALVIAGRVLSTDGTPLKDAVLDLWHADPKGGYDTKSAKFLLRGRVKADKDGLYRVETVMPGQYDLGASKRPAHIHYKISAPKHKRLTTQLYFKGDPYIKNDEFVRESLIIPVDKGAGTFDIVLATA